MSTSILPTVTGSQAAWQATLKHLREHGKSVVLARPDQERDPDTPYEIIQNVDSADYIPLGMELTIDGRRMISGFEKTDQRDFYDLAVGNVPFGQYHVNDPAYNKLGFNMMSRI